MASASATSVSGVSQDDNWGTPPTPAAPPTPLNVTVLAVLAVVGFVLYLVGKKNRWI